MAKATIGSNVLIVNVVLNINPLAPEFSFKFLAHPAY